MRRLILASAVVIAAFASGACGDSNKATDDAAPGTPDAPQGVVDAMPGPPDVACFTNPTTHNEIINACTNAQSVDKNPSLPLTLADGGLPPLP